MLVHCCSLEEALAAADVLCLMYTCIMETLEAADVLCLMYTCIMEALEAADVNMYVYIYKYIYHQLFDYASNMLHVQSLSPSLSCTSYACTQVECRSLEEAKEAAGAGAHIIMLDNFQPEAYMSDYTCLVNHHVGQLPTGGIHMY